MDYVVRDPRKSPKSIVLQGKFQENLPLKLKTPERKKKLGIFCMYGNGPELDS